MSKSSKLPLVLKYGSVLVMEAIAQNNLKVEGDERYVQMTRDQCREFWAAKYEGNFRGPIRIECRTMGAAFRWRPWGDKLIVKIVGEKT